MPRILLLFVFLASLFLATQLTAQQPKLGPLDGENLPATEIDRVKVGDLAPDFRLADEQGNVHQLSQYRGKKNVVLVIYRGYW